MTAPQSPVLEIGTNFTATCWINGAPQLTVDDLHWMHAQIEIPKENYRKINRTAVQVTIPVTDTQGKLDLLLCQCKEEFVQINTRRCQHGIFMRKSCECFWNSVVEPILNFEWLFDFSVYNLKSNRSSCTLFNSLSLYFINTTLVNEWLQFLTL